MSVDCSCAVQLIYELLLDVSFSGFFFFQAEDGIRDLVRSRGLGDVYKRQAIRRRDRRPVRAAIDPSLPRSNKAGRRRGPRPSRCLLYTSDAADERSSVDLGGRRIIKKNKRHTAIGVDGRENTHHFREQYTSHCEKVK